MRKINDERTDGRTDRQQDESDFIGRCPTSADRSIKYIHKNKNLSKNLLKLKSNIARNSTL